MKLPGLRTLAGAILLTTGTLYLAFLVDRTNFTSLFASFCLAFAGYAALVYRPETKQIKMLIGLGIALRLALVFAFPLLSDDLYRFIWDGHLIAAGHNPFAHLPAFYLEAGNAVPGLTQELYAKLNSPEYYTIYPPVAQGVFTLAVWINPESWYGAAVVMKLFLFTCELGSLWLLWKLLSDRTRLLFYWLNPLILVEITGNLHFEGAMIFFLLLAYYWLQRTRWVAAAMAMAAAVASKLLPLMLLPFLIQRLWVRQKSKYMLDTVDIASSRFWSTFGLEALDRVRPFWIFSVVFGVSCLAFFAPFLLSPDFISGFRSSLELYQQKFEFNASLYYLARAYGYYQVGWNQIATIGPLLAKIAAGGILFLALVDRRKHWASLPEGWLFAFVLYLLCATTVHPWYLAVPIVLCCFTRWRFPLVWSFLIMLTYTSYVTVPYEENLWLVAVEYLLVGGFAVWETTKTSPASS
ncbi:MAG: hypothetical protein AAFZ52_03300 [Bacteroidota bacterium]